jgi:TonB family protein
MSAWKYHPLGCVLLLLCGIASAAENAPPTPPAQASQARIALMSNVEKRCPALRTAREGDTEVAVVEFLVGASGVPSRPSVTSSSGSQELDAAAVSCVLKLRFQPATRLGEGTAVESWQQMGWKWAPPVRPAGAATVPPGTATAPPPAAAAAAPAPLAGAAAVTPSSTAATSGVAASSSAAAAAPADSRAEVRVCVDANGKLTEAPKLIRASGDPQFDAAVVNVAKSGSGYYRPGNSKIPACVRLAISAGGP